MAVQSPGPSWTHSHLLFSRMFLPGVGRSFIEARKDIARHDVATCGIAAEIYRLDHGTYPASLDALDALVPNYLAVLPQDTFSGKPLLFKSLPNGILIYSIGPNGRDDAGVDAPTEPRPDDIAWRVERPLPAQP